MRRLLLIGTKFPRLKSVGWSEWAHQNILDYQGLVFDCRDQRYEIYQPALREMLLKYLQSGHVIFVILPSSKSLSGGTAKIEFLPYLKLKVRPHRGITLNLALKHSLFQEYLKVLQGHEIVFDCVMPANPLGVIQSAITDNISNNVCVKWGSVYILHPPARFFAEQGLRTIIAQFGPDFEEPELDPAPDWAKQVTKQVPGIQEINTRVESVSVQIDSLEDERRKELESKEKLETWGQLLWLSGIPLQDRVRDAFKFLGFTVEPHDPTGHAGDLVAKHGQYIFIMEVTGSTGGITIEKGRQLMQWVIEAEPEEVHGVLVGNAFRNDPPEKRPPSANHNIFAAELEKMAKKRGLALLETRELFRIVCAKLGGTKFPLEKICEDLSTDGEVHFRL